MKTRNFFTSFFIFIVKTSLIESLQNAQKFDCAKDDACICSATMVRLCKSMDGNLTIANLPKEISKISPDFILTDLNENTLQFLWSLTLSNNPGLEHWGVIFAEYKESLRELKLSENPRLEPRPLRKFLLQNSALTRLEIGRNGFNASEKLRSAMKSNINLNTSESIVFENKSLERLKLGIKDGNGIATKPMSSFIALPAIKILDTARKTFEQAQNKTRGFFKAIPGRMGAVTDQTQKLMGLDSYCLSFESSFTILINLIVAVVFQCMTQE